MSKPIQFKDTLLGVDNLNLSVGGKTRVTNISFALCPGERVWLIGASGSGKSMTVKAVAGALSPDVSVSGTIRVNDVDVSQLNTLVRPHSARVATIFQDFATVLNPLIGRLK